MFGWIRKRYAENETLRYLSQLAHEYGPAWVVASHIVGTVTLLLLYILLIILNIDPSQISDYLKLGPDLRWWVDEYGLIAAAYVLNKIIFPVRMVLEVLLVRRIHVPVNRALQPWVDALWRVLGRPEDNEVGEDVGYEMVMQCADEPDEAKMPGENVCESEADDEQGRSSDSVTETGTLVGSVAANADHILHMA